MKVNTVASGPLDQRSMRSRDLALFGERQPVQLSIPIDETIWEALLLQESVVLENPTHPHIEQYLATVRKLLQEALKRHSAQSAPYWSPKGKFRQMVHIAEVNHTLDQLLNDIRAGHPATLLARRLDAIRGLLLDLWL